MIALSQFLAKDYREFGVELLPRLRRLSGRRLYLSGATGFFGRNMLALLAWLDQQGVRFEVEALSRDPEGFLARNAWCRDFRWMRWHRGDARRPWPSSGPLDLVLHAATDTAAAAHVDKAAMFEGIMEGAKRALELAASRCARRLLLCGSGAQYGALGSEGGGVRENVGAACDSSVIESAYGEGKRVAELLAALEAARSGLQVVNTRCFAFVGPGLPIDGHFAIGNFIRDALNGKAIHLQSDGSAVRSYLYGADLAAWLLLLLLEAPGGSIVNVGSDKSLSIRELAQRVAAVAAPGLPIHVGPSRAEPRSFYVPNIDQARSLGLGVWTPLDRAIERTAHWYRLLTA